MCVYVHTCIDAWVNVCMNECMYGWMSVSLNGWLSSINALLCLLVYVCVVSSFICSALCRWCHFNNHRLSALDPRLWMCIYVMYIDDVGQYCRRCWLCLGILKTNVNSVGVVRNIVYLWSVCACDRCALCFLCCIVALFGFLHRGDI